MTRCHVKGQSRVPGACQTPMRSSNHQGLPRGQGRKPLQFKVNGKESKYSLGMVSCYLHDRDTLFQIKHRNDALTRGTHAHVMGMGTLGRSCEIQPSPAPCRVIT